MAVTDRRGNQLAVGAKVFLPCIVDRRNNPRDREGKPTDDVDLVPVVKDDGPPVIYSLKSAQLENPAAKKGETVNLPCTIVELIEPAEGEPRDFTANDVKMTPAVPDHSKPGQVLSVKARQIDRMSDAEQTADPQAVQAAESPA